MLEEPWNRTGGFRRRPGVVLALWLATGAGSTAACDDPALHPQLQPEMIEVNALLASLPPQTPGPIQLKYKIDDERSTGKATAVRLSFWPIKPYDHGRFVVTSSPGLDLATNSRSGEIPYKGTVALELVPSRAGYHYLKIETIVQESGGEEKRNILLLPIPVGSDHANVAEQRQLGVITPSGTAGAGFAGSKVADALLRRGHSDSVAELNGGPAPTLQGKETIIEK